MSTIKVSNLQNASAASPAIVLAADGTATAQFSSLNGGPLAGMRNRIINGDMRLDQRNAGASVTTPTNYTLDRWQAGISGSATYTVQRNAGSVTPPAGFTNYLGFTSSSAYSLASNDRVGIFQGIEGFNAADLAFGTANAKSITLSFWVRSSLTGTFGGVLANSAYNRCYVYSYTIAAANTWEYKTITIPGDTTGTWLTDNSAGINISFAVGVGSSLVTTPGSWGGTTYFAPTGQVNVAGTNGATFYITGVQLEAGSVATPFERRLNELALCQRYYAKSYQIDTVPGTVTRTGGIQLGSYSNTATSMNNGVGFRFPVVMRISPTTTGYDPDAANTTGQGRWDAAGVAATQGALTLGAIGDAGVGSVTIATTGRTAGDGLTVLFHYTASAEL